MKDRKIKSFIDEVEAMAREYEDSIMTAVSEIEDFLERMLTPKPKPVLEIENTKRTFSVLAKPEVVVTTPDLIPQPKKEVKEVREIVLVEKPAPKIKRNYGKVIKIFFISALSSTKLLLDGLDGSIEDFSDNSIAFISSLFHYKKSKKLKSFNFILNNTNFAHKETIRKQFDWKAFNTVLFPLDEKGVKVLKASVKTEPESFSQLNSFVNIANSLYLLHQRGISFTTLSAIDYTQSHRANIFLDILRHEELVKKLIVLDKNI